MSIDVVFIQIALKFVHEQWAIIGLDNGVVLNQRQAIIWTNNGPLYWRTCASSGLNGLMISPRTNWVLYKNTYGCQGASPHRNFEHTKHYTFGIFTKRAPIPVEFWQHHLFLLVINEHGYES